MPNPWDTVSNSLSGLFGNRSGGGQIPYGNDQRTFDVNSPGQFDWKGLYPTMPDRTTPPPVPQVTGNQVTGNPLSSLGVSDAQFNSYLQQIGSNYDPATLGVDTNPYTRPRDPFEQPKAPGRWTPASAYTPLTPDQLARYNALAGQDLDTAGSGYVRPRGPLPGPRTTPLSYGAGPTSGPGSYIAPNSPTAILRPAAGYNSRQLESMGQAFLPDERLATLTQPGAGTLVTVGPGRPTSAQEYTSRGYVIKKAVTDPATGQTTYVAVGPSEMLQTGQAYWVSRG